MKFTFDHGATSFPIELTPGSSGKSFRVHAADQTLDIEILQAKDGFLEFLINGKHITAHVSTDNARRWVTVNGQTLVLTKSSGSRKSRGGHAHAAGEMTAPMPGQIRALNVEEGDDVTRGQTLLLLEAMKMEIRVQAPQDGKIKKIFVKQGQTVEREQLLIEIE